MEITIMGYIGCSRGSFVVCSFGAGDGWMWSLRMLGVQSWVFAGVQGLGGSGSVGGDGRLGGRRRQQLGFHFVCSIWSF